VGAHVLTIIGTRPEAIKMAPLVLELEASEAFQHTLAVTGQHRALLHQALDIFGITPKHDLDIMQEGQRLDEILTRTLSRLSEIVRAEKPDCILVHGDTTSTLSGALAGFYNKVKVGHVEAGLRTGDRFLPYPEEINRRLADQIADYYFCPTDGAADNLRREGLTHGEITVTGNTVVDAVRLVMVMPAELPEDAARFILRFPEFVIVTAHRRENWGEPLKRIGEALRSFALANPEVGLLACLHPNPLLRKGLEPFLGGLPNSLMTPAPGYAAFVHLMQRSQFILTDSGGVQEEACALGKFVLVLRGQTERPEAVEAGFANVIGTEAARVMEEMGVALEGTRECLLPPAGVLNPFGDGFASARIVEFLKTRLGS
jgi:UDP-N-acetylglucosamine 2-epimerase (non-hydrolysing)